MECTNINTESITTLINLLFTSFIAVWFFMMFLSYWFHKLVINPKDRKEGDLLIHAISSNVEKSLDDRGLICR